MLGIHSRAASLFVRRRQYLLVRVDHEHGQQFCGCGLAGVLTNGVQVTGHLGKALAGAIDDDRSIFDSTSDGSYENGSIDQSSFDIRVSHRRTYGTIYEGHTLDPMPTQI